MVPKVFEPLKFCCILFFFLFICGLSIFFCVSKSPSLKIGEDMDRLSARILWICYDEPPGELCFEHETKKKEIY